MQANMLRLSPYREFDWVLMGILALLSVSCVLEFTSVTMQTKAELAKHRQGVCPGLHPHDAGADTAGYGNLAHLFTGSAVRVVSRRHPVEAGGNSGMYLCRADRWCLEKRQAIEALSESPV